MSLLSSARDIPGGKLLVASVGEANIDALRDMIDILRDKLTPSIIVLGSVWEGKPVFLAAVAPELTARGYHAGNIVKKMSEIAGGGGGGKPNLAQGGGRNTTKLHTALDAVNEFIK
jgi:alanyl-tRNA synthetase